ncbi:uncharacterized protein [Asterias amurensis]|uniref:uncharacterized protein n=1 Tax=Asterias amurensis TaxID=7602 RepID=UPI003AB791D2
MNSLNRAITSPFSIFRKRSDPLQLNPEAMPAMLDVEEEEDGFTIVGQSWSERNTLYPPPAVPPPPSYQQVSGYRLPEYKDVSRSWSEPPSSTDGPLQQTPNGLISQDINTDYSQPHVTNCSSNHPYLHDVPFKLSPRIDTLNTEDTFYRDYIPHLDLSELTYDFSVEHQMLLSHALLKQCCSEENDIACDDSSDHFQEGHLIQQFGQQAVVAQEMFDFKGMDSRGNQCSGVQDLISF